MRRENGSLLSDDLSEGYEEHDKRYFTVLRGTIVSASSHRLRSRLDIDGNNKRPLRSRAYRFARRSRLTLGCVRLAQRSLINRI